MTNEQILKKAIEKAVKNGWETDIISVNPGYEWKFISSHDFAKALWGEERFEQFLPDYSEEHRFLGGKLCYPYNEGAGMTYKVATWKYHLMKMVLEKEPLKYIEKFL